MQAWPETCDTLLARLRDPADMQAWSEFTRLYEPVIKGFVTGRGLQAADAQDICQHVLWAVARAADDWPGHAEPGRFRKWLATVTRNATLNVLQREMRHRGSGRSSVWDYLNTLTWTRLGKWSAWTRSTARRPGWWNPVSARKCGNCSTAPPWGARRLKWWRWNWENCRERPTRRVAG